MSFRSGKWKWVGLCWVVSMALVVAVGCDALEDLGFEEWEEPEFECDHDGECPVGYFCDDGICSNAGGGGGGGAGGVSTQRIDGVCQDWCDQGEQCYGVDPSERPECMAECEDVIRSYVDDTHEACGAAILSIDECVARLSCNALEEQMNETHDHCASERAYAEEQCAVSEGSEELQALCDQSCQMEMDCLDIEPDESFYCDDQCAGNVEGWYAEQDEACAQADLEMWQCETTLSCQEFVEYREGTAPHCVDEQQAFQQECQ